MKCYCLIQYLLEANHWKEKSQSTTNKEGTAPNWHLPHTREPHVEEVRSLGFMKIKMAPNGLKSSSRFSKMMGLNWMVVWHLTPPCLLIMWTLAPLLLGNQMAMLNLQFAINNHKKRLKGPNSLFYLNYTNKRQKEIKKDNHFYFFFKSR